MNNHKLAYFGGGRVVSACRRSCCWHFDQERFCTYFERVGGCNGAHCFQGAFINRDVVWAGSPVLCRFLPPGPQSVPYLAEAPSDEG